VDGDGDMDVLSASFGDDTIAWYENPRDNIALVNYSSGSTNTELTFNYTVAAGENSSDLDYVSTAALTLNGGTIKDAAGNAATLTLASPGASNSLGANKALVVDGVVPTVSSVTSSTANGTYKVGDAISIQVTFSESVTVSGTPQLTLETGGTDAVVDYASGSGGAALTFTYTVGSGHTASDLDYASTSALALNGGTIQDAAGNAATLTLASPGASNSLGANKALVVDGVVPTVSSVTSSRRNRTVIRSWLVSGPKGMSWWYFRWVAVPGSLALTFDSRNRRFGPKTWVVASRAMLSRMKAR